MHRSLFYTHALPQLRSFLPITRSRLTLLGHSPTACTSLGRPLHMWTCGSHSRRIPSPRYRHQETIEDSLRRHALHGHKSSHSSQVYPTRTFRAHLGTQDHKKAQHYQEGIQEEQETPSLTKGEYRTLRTLVYNLQFKHHLSGIRSDLLSGMCGLHTLVTVLFPSSTRHA